MTECFVIQPFDNDKFDRRYNEVFSPAILAAQFSPYRVDKDPSANDLVESIKSGIERSRVVMADLSLDNPNVWYELGFALANRKPYCLISSDERAAKYPFDVSHLKIISYKTGSPSDFTDLSSKITERLVAVSTQDNKLQAIAPSIATLKTEGGLSAFEQVALAIIFEEHFDGGLTAYSVNTKMERAGFNKTASVLALAKLQKKALVEVKQEYDADRDERYTMVNISNTGVQWITENEDKLSLLVKPEPMSDDPPF